MKKILVLTAALALFAAPSFATIVGGKHDLSTMGIGTTEICVFCHTPHGADTNAGVTFPLSNRGAYGSAMCMTCHDGSVAYADMTNPPNGTVAGPAYSDFTGFGADLAAYNAGPNHPVGAGAVWTAMAVDGMQTTTPAVVGGKQIIALGQTVECSSCHDVHEPAFAPFLKVSNASSALCLACHNK